MKIIVIGSGIAGLIFSLACQRHGFNITLYEKTKRLQPIGGGLLLWPHGLRYLQRLGLDACLKPFYVAVNQCEIISHTGKNIFNEDCHLLYNALGGAILPIDRTQLQQALLTELPISTLQLGKKCVHIAHEPKQVRVYFEDGTEDVADMVVGADGIHSIVREKMNISAVPTYTECCWWGGIVDQQYAPFLSNYKTSIAMHIGKLFIAWPITQQRYMWYLPVKMPLSHFKQGKEGWHQLEAICSDWNEDIQRIITAPTNPKQRFHFPIHTLAPSMTWSNQRMVLIGDAAHTLGPILGQGANQAIEDAFLLFDCLSKMKKNDLAATLSDYENLRRAKYFHLALLENQTAAHMIHDTDESLEAFQQQLPSMDLLTFYQDLIPLLNASI